MKMFGPLRRFAAEIAVVSPRKAALSIVLMGAMSLTEGMGVFLPLYLYSSLLSIVLFQT